MLTVPDCPHRAVTLERLRAALTSVGRGDVPVTERQVHNAAEALLLGMHGSPTILVDGRDAFGGDAAEASLSCRLYRTNGGVDGAPTADALMEALR